MIVNKSFLMEEEQEPKEDKKEETADRKSTRLNSSH